MSGSTTTDALQRVLAAQHAAVWTFGSLGAATSMSATPDLFSRVSDAWAAHRERRDRLTTMLLALDVRPVGSQAAYAVPGPLSSPQEVESSAARVELIVAEAWSFLVATSTGGTRRWAAEVLTELALSALGFGAVADPLPGARDLLPG